MVPLFLFLPLRPQPNYSHPRLASYYGRNGPEVSAYNPTQPLWKSFAKRLVQSVGTLPFWLAVLLAMLVPLARREPVFRKMAIVAGVFFLAMAFETYHMAHYYAPIWAAFALMIAIWAERAWDFRVRGGPAGKVLVFLALASPGIDSVVRPEVKNLVFHPSRPEDWPNRREALIEHLTALNRRHLVIVRYPSPDWNTGEEWVYNGADIDRQHVIFAHDLGPEENRALLCYYSDRTVWLMTFDTSTALEHIHPDYGTIPGIEIAHPFCGQ
jgi:hypothetical protein